MIKSAIHEKFLSLEVRLNSSIDSMHDNNGKLSIRLKGHCVFFLLLELPSLSNYALNPFLKEMIVGYTHLYLDKVHLKPNLKV
jgi:hypothetical protein